MRSHQVDPGNRAEASFRNRKIWDVLQYGVLVSLAALVSVLLNGCAGLANGTTGNPPSTLEITNVQTTSPTTSSAQILWKTNVAADSAVNYGTSPSYGLSTPVDSAMVTNHQITLSGLAAGTTYYYQVSSTDSKGNHGNSGGHGFNTSGFSISGTISPATGGSGKILTLGGAANAATVSRANVTGVNFTDTTASAAPTITTQPGNQTVTAGQTATFTVVATGTAPLTYQWQKNGVNVSGATAASYTTAATTTADSGTTFRVVVNNTAGTVTSAAATLTVTAATVTPTITTQPANQTVTTGQTATFSVAATGSAPLSYQWNKNGAAIAGATSSRYTTAATTSSDNGFSFAVAVSNSAGKVTSNAATLTVNAAAPTVSFSPTSLTFGSQPLGTSSSAQVVTFSNTGSGTLTFGTVP